MGRSTKFNAIVLTSVAAAGLGVAVAAAFSEPTENDDEIVNPVPGELLTTFSVRTRVTKGFSASAVY